MRLLHFLALYFSMASIALRTDFSRTPNYLTLDKLGDYRLDILVYDQFLKTVSNFLLWGLGEFCSFCLECSFSGCSCAWFLVVDQVSVWLAAFPRSRSGSASVSGLSFRTLVAISSPTGPIIGWRHYYACLFTSLPSRRDNPGEQRTRPASPSFWTQR